MSAENLDALAKPRNPILSRSRLLAPIALAIALSGCSSDNKTANNNYRYGYLVDNPVISTLMDSADLYATTSGRQGISLGSFNSPTAGNAGGSMRILERLNCAVQNSDSSSPITVDIDTKGLEPEQLVALTVTTEGEDKSQAVGVLYVGATKNLHMEAKGEVHTLPITVDEVTYQEKNVHLWSERDITFKLALLNKYGDGTNVETVDRALVGIRGYSSSAMGIPFCNGRSSGVSRANRN